MYPIPAANFCSDGSRLCHNPLAVALEGLDLVAVSRSLSQLAEREDDLVDAFLERLEVVEMPPGREGAGVHVRREEGFAVRLMRGDRSWMASGDVLAPGDFLAALRQVARSWPQAAYPAPALRPPAWGPVLVGRELRRFPAALNRALRRRMVAFPLEARVRHHRRWVQLVGAHLIPDPESEMYYSVEITSAWGRHGLLATALGEETVEALAEALATGFEARRAAPPGVVDGCVTLSPQATAIFLHEAVSHALEADTLALGGRLEAAIGLRMGPPGLSVLDDPTTAPPAVRRATDDEGRPVERRWLLRDGLVEQPLADAYWSQRSSALLPGAGRRGGRLDSPSPRSSHLVLLAGEGSAAELLAGEGIWVPQISRGRLLVDSGICHLKAPYGFRFRDGELGEAVGPFHLAGRVAELLAAIEVIGSQVRSSGAGWCAKGRQRVPVWATTPAIRLARARVGA